MSERPPEPLQYLGASFGLTHPLLTFWRRTGFQPLYLRQTASDVTGAPPCPNRRHTARNAARLRLQRLPKVKRRLPRRPRGGGLEEGVLQPTARRCKGWNPAAPARSEPAQWASEWCGDAGGACRGALVYSGQAAAQCRGGGYGVGGAFRGGLPRAPHGAVAVRFQVQPPTLLLPPQLARLQSCASPESLPEVALKPPVIWFGIFVCS